ncbi:hypothetical protein N7925_34515 [Streptomyces sp. CA-278952]|uniref:hypothetical protein n=1 Tax=Streptomyces sp. CA-278952 TaxID=2980556 RepID=UPI002367A25E|nr:hypothetical protein [Streptomyces sp. CA-278952]WDG33085.1 hypothetical protein N7925_34515 [Streptomyces sp. CA-278952]
MTIVMSGAPGCHRPAATSRSTTALSRAAVTAVASSAGPSRTTSKIPVHDVAPGSRTATNE